MWTFIIVYVLVCLVGVGLTFIFQQYIEERVDKYYDDGVQ
jgi:hypothetical protein